MLGRIFPTKASYQTAAPFVLAALLLVATLLISFLSGYQIYRRFRDAKEDEAQRNIDFLALVAETYQSSISRDARMYMDVPKPTPGTVDSQTSGTQGKRNDEAWQKQIDTLREDQRKYLGPDPVPVILDRIAKISGPLSSAALFYPQRYTIYDSSDILPPGSWLNLRKNDEGAFLHAASATTISTIATTTFRTTVPTTLDEPQVVHQYTPIFYTPSEPKYLPPEQRKKQLGAILRIEVPYKKLKQTREIQRLGLSLAAVVTGLTAIVALLFYRLMGSFIRISETAAHADRLQAMGTLSAGIAHELRNPLGIIRALAEGLRADFEEDDPRREMVDDITEEVERLGHLVADYLQFARPDVRQPDDQARPVEIIENLMQLLRKGDKAAVPLELRADRNPPDVAMNSTAFRQVMMNLIMNAIEASDSNQPIEIEFQTRRNGTQVRITVTDRGCGISEREQRHIFDPFYTSKAQGTGLGLAICYQLVTECRGKIGIESAEGKGTTVELILPAVPAKPPMELKN
jgi:signal transduction histidine kinase